MTCSLEGKKALVTGGSRGIGRAIALALADAGVDVAVASRKMPDLERVAEEIKGRGREAIAVPAHVGRLDQISEMVEKVRNVFGTIDILVNNAATNPTMAQAIDVDERGWDSIMNLNLKGLFFTSQYVARIMGERGGGSIINVSSVEGITPGILPVYSISKAGVIFATKVMARQWAHMNIRVNCIAPGLTRTEFSRALWDNPDILGAALTMTPMGRIGEPEEMTGAVLFFASDASSGYVTGQVLAVDGGNTI
ncbi:MAG: glucose 1-dehydrogenase [Syntrophales bacterium]|jgi:NAD(P)-dependent dehydrogenase (short-subunit alcohol dehydrogenase family)|nr:glucose 1-dehydrogenase [Syntrophales bacterium]MCK9527418.1 glucose 1-dehydrogenase [Syntrophales bacterium]MDX9921520.1 glucose 1-dehydrogenase [Syntrophales bacterium]